MKKRDLIPNVLVEYAPQKRTIFSKYRSASTGNSDSYSNTFFLQFPHILFLKQHYDGANILYCAFYDKPLTSETQDVCLPWMQNVYGLGRVCLRSEYSSPLKNLIDLFWSQVFNFDGPFGIPALLGMFGEIETLNDLQTIHQKYDDIGLAISKALLKWQNTSYEEILRKMNEPMPPVILKWCGSDQYEDNASYQFKWKFSDWCEAVTKKHRYGLSLRDIKFDAEYKSC